MITTTYTVAGMTCDHCVRAVTAEVGALPSVSAVTIDLPTGSVTVTSDVALDIDSLRSAIDEAGYDLVA
jgi:copper ion binding protein